MAYIAVYMLMLEMRLEVNFFDPAAVPFLAQLYGHAVKQPRVHESLIHCRSMRKYHAKFLASVNNLTWFGASNHVTFYLFLVLCL